MLLALRSFHFISVSSLLSLPQDFGRCKSGLLPQRSFVVSPFLYSFHVAAILSHKGHSDDLTHNNMTCVRTYFTFCELDSTAPTAMHVDLESVSESFQALFIADHDILKDIFASRTKWNKFGDVRAASANKGTGESKKSDMELSDAVMDEFLARKGGGGQNGE
ncbi:hypothetical protein C8J56DRAFT_900747 [Mycena floridula]|nr:hypothetical protein C8J56DRAFT_900747 [Mycena floridula]